MLSKIFGPKRESYETRKGHDKIHDLYSKNKYYLRDQIKENEKGWACSMYGGEEKWVQDLGGENRTRLKCMSFLSL
jgi:rRNA processing protein Gar1